MNRITLVALSFLALSACGKAAPTTTQMRSQVAESVAIVRLPAGGSGSGFVVEAKSGRKFIATNAHVCEKEGAPLHIQFASDGPVYVEQAIAVDVAEDLCLVSLADQSLTALEIASTAKPGDHVYTAGHPLGKGLVITEGNVVDAIEEYEVGGYPEAFCTAGAGQLHETFFGQMTCVIKHRAIDFNALIYPGNSGGPLLNEKGQVVGIDFAGGELGGAALYAEALKTLLRQQ